MSMAAASAVAAAASDPAVVIRSRSDVLAEVARPEVGLAVWARPLDPLLHDWLMLPGRRDITGGRVLVPLDRCVEAVVTLLGHKPGPLVADIFALALRFCAVAGTDLVDIRLEEIAHDACWRFHRDNVRLRMVTTYVGPGTEIVPAAHSAAAIAQQREYDGPSYMLPPGAVALFRGSQSASGGVVHRSPPIAHRGLRRLFLCINAPSAASPEIWSPR
jgi:hypothetical protein